MRKRLGHILMMLWPWLSLGLTACGDDDDDYVYPSVITSFVDVHTDVEGVASTLTTDEGVTWDIHARDGLGGLTPDSTYRMVTKYELLDREVQLYTAQKVISPVPKARADYKEVHTDPVELTSIWRGGDHLNMVLKAMVKDQTHVYHFIDLGLTTDSVDSHRRLDLMLYHDRRDDLEAFSRTIYLSVPLSGYAATLLPGDSIRFTLQTYAEGTTSRTFAW